MNDSSSTHWLSRAAVFSWRYLLFLAAVYVTFVAVATVKVVIIPVLLALFVTSVLSPPVQWLKGRGWSPALATWGGFALVIPIVAIVGALLVPSLADGLGPLGDDLGAATDSAVEWLSEGPLHLSDTEIQDYIDTGVEQIRSNMGSIATGLLGGATVAFEIVTGAVLTLLAAFFYLKDGDRARNALLARVANPDRVDRGLTAAWRTLASYVRGLAIVGAVDATFIGIGLAIVGTPLVLPLMVLVFIGGFFPIVGAFLSGLVAVAVSFVHGGITDALIVLAVVVGVQQFEGHVLYPIVFKRALELHPLIILLAIGVGGVAFGIVGAFLSVPMTAVGVAVHQAVADHPDQNLVSLMSSRTYERPTIELADNEDESTDQA